MNVVIEGNRNPNNPIDKDCLKKVENETVMIEDSENIVFKIFDDGKLLGDVVGHVAPNQAGILLTRAHINKSENEKEAIFKHVLETIFNYNFMGQHILQISIWGEEFGIDINTFIHIGCVGHDGLGSSYYQLLNPQYLEIVRQYTASDENILVLIKRYNNYQRRKSKQQTELLKKIKTANDIIADPTLSEDEKAGSKSQVIWCEEAIQALGDTEPYTNEEAENLQHKR